MNGEDEIDDAETEQDAEFARATIQARPGIARDPEIRSVEHSLNWAEQFASTPRSEVLRQRLNLTNLVSNAVQRKQELLAQTNDKAAALHFNTQKFNEWERQAPLREELLRARIEAQGAGTRYQMYKDGQTARQMGVYYRGVRDIQEKHPIGSKEFADAYLDFISQDELGFARTTKEFQEDAKILSRAHDTTAETKATIDSFRAATGKEPSSIERTAAGGLRIEAKSGDEDFEKELRGLELKPYAFENKGAWKKVGDSMVFADPAVGLPKTIGLKTYERLQAAYDARQGTAEPVGTGGPTPSPTPAAQRFKFDPATGELK